MTNSDEVPVSPLVTGYTGSGKSITLYSGLYDGGQKSPAR